jgi:hypothetical protein
MAATTGLAAAAEPALSPPYELRVSAREDSAQKDAETGADLVFLTDGKSKDTNLYFHQRSWLADSSLILFSSSRRPGGLMAYVVESGELVQITAADGSRLGGVSAAVDRNSVLGTAGKRVVEIQLILTVSESGGARHARVVAREREFCTVTGLDGTFGESCDGRYIAIGRTAPEPGNRPGIVVIDEQTGKWEQLCDIPNGVTYHGHVQWSVTNPNWLSFAGAPNRLCVVDIRDRRIWSPYHELPGELVTHESWWVDDQLIFCGGIHSAPTEESHVKAIDMHTGAVRIVGAGSWWPDAVPKELAKRNWWHASASADGRWIAADNWHGDIMLFEGKTTRPRLLTTNHRTYGKGEHPHVGWDRRGRQVIFTSEKGGAAKVCVATISTVWQEELTRVQVGLDAK